MSVLPKITNQMEHPDLKDAIMLNTGEEARNALAWLLGHSLQALKQAKEKKKHLVISKNWKFKTEEEAVKFWVVANDLLEKVTEEKFHAARILTRHEGHLMVVICCGVEESKFRTIMEGLEAGSERPCGHCGKEAADNSKCGGCGAVAYCDKKCQRADWKEHKEACKEKSKLYKSVGLTVT